MLGFSCETHSQNIIENSYSILNSIPQDYEVNILSVNNSHVYTVSGLIFKARANQMQNVQCGKLSMEYDYLIFSLLADLDRIVEHCMNVSILILNN